MMWVVGREGLLSYTVYGPTALEMPQANMSSGGSFTVVGHVHAPRRRKKVKRADLGKRKWVASAMNVNRVTKGAQRASREEGTIL